MNCQTITTTTYTDDTCDTVSTTVSAVSVSANTCISGDSGYSYLTSCYYGTDLPDVSFDAIYLSRYTNGETGCETMPDRFDAFSNGYCFEKTNPAASHLYSCDGTTPSKYQKYMQ